MADDKKTQLGTSGERANRPTGGQTPPPAAATGTPPPVAQGSGEVSTSAKTAYLQEAPDPLLGSTLAGRYLIERKLGEGGMGAVYLATHTVLEKPVALKILHGELGRKPDLVERFMQEAKAASRIRHENVIDISDFGSTPEGYVFFAMELLKGHDLHDEVARARAASQLLPWARSKKIFLQVCAALSAAHARGIVHRDLKPENIYLVEFLGDHDFVKLLDFGIAKLTEGEGGDGGGRKLTKTGMLFGTPEYMSPEQAKGESVDARVDVYAMGCILFQLVSGRVPFQADNFMGVLSMHLTEPPPEIPPEVFDQIGAPRALAAVIDRALEKDRTVRWQTIDELAGAVREVCGDPPAADRSGKMAAASVPAPVATTRARPPTSEVRPGGASASGAMRPTGANASGGMAPVRSRPSTERQKTEWTGNLRVPEELVADEPAAAPAKSKLPLVLGGAAILIGGGVAAMVLAGRGGAAAGPGSAAGSAAGSAVVTAPTPPPTPPAPPAPPPLPERVKLELDSQPRGATVTDLSTGKAIGVTPLAFSVPGSLTSRAFKFHLGGYGDHTVELVPSHDLEDKEVLVRGARATVVRVPDKAPVAGAGSAVAAGSAATSTGPVVAPDHGTPSSDGSAPPGPGSATAPETKPPDGAGSAAPVAKPPEGAGSGAGKPPDDTIELKPLPGVGVQVGSGS